MDGDQTPRRPVESAIGFFADLRSADYDTLIRRLNRIHLKRGEVLIKAGTPSDTFYVVMSGRFSIATPGSNDPIAEVSAGQPIGEIGFFAGITRTATVVAMRDSSVLSLTRTDFDALSESIPRLQSVLIKALARRLADTSRNIIAVPGLPKARTLAIVAAPDCPGLSSFLERFKRKLSENNVALFVDRETVEERFGPIDENAQEVGFWLNTREEDHDFVVYSCGPEPDKWSRLALRQADQVLLIIDARNPSPVTPLERSAIDIHAKSHRQLVLLHRRRAPCASGTADILKHRPVFQHHHVALGDDEDVSRVVRTLAGSALGYVAGGGGAFGSAHVGVYKACIEAGMKFDVFGGTSVGSAMTAAFALGHPPDEINQRTGEIFVNERVLKRLTIPRYSLIDHKHFDVALRENFTDVMIEDLWKPYFAVATDLCSNAPKVITTGKLWHAIRASSALPAVLPPFFSSDGEMLVDGGLSNNIPVDVMHSRKRGPNIVVSFSPERVNQYDIDYESIPGSLELAGRLANPFSAPLPKAPGIPEVIMRSMLANQNMERLDLKETDWFVQPPLITGVGFMNWECHTQLYERAYDHMKREIARKQAEGHQDAAIRS